MALRLLHIMFIFTMLTGCISKPAHREAGTHALVRSWMPIQEVNGDVPDDPYRLLLLPGDYVLQVQYNTYRKTFLCDFRFEARAGYSYDIVDHSNEQPLVLYRWVRANGAWAERRDAVDPDCVASRR